MSTLAKFYQQSDDHLDYDIKFDSFLPSGDNIADADVTADSGLTVGAVTISGQIVKVYLGGGVNGTSYKVNCRITSVAGRIKNHEFYLVVKDT